MAVSKTTFAAQSWSETGSTSVCHNLLFGRGPSVDGFGGGTEVATSPNADARGE